MKILALDQASRTTGFSIYEDGKLIQYGKFTFTDTDFAIRLNKIRNKLKSIISENKIEAILFEDIQLQDSANNNVDTFKKLASVHAIVSELAVDMKIPASAVYSTVWKSGVGVKGPNRAAQKKAAQDWVENKFNIRPTEDECDAICIGWYYFNPKPIKTGAW